MKILIVKSSAIGDIFQAFYVLEPIKMAYPTAQIDWVVEAPFKDIVTSNPLIHEAIVIETKKWRKFKNLSTFRETIKKLRQTKYDFVIDLQGNIKSGLVTLFAKGVKGGYGWETSPEKVNTFFTSKHTNPIPGQNQRDDYLNIVETTLGRTLSRPKPDVKLKPFKNVMVCPGSAWPNKQLTDKTLLEFLQLLSPNGYTFHMVWGSDLERATCEKIKDNLSNVEIVERRPIPQLGNLMKTMDLVIAMDSMALHLAGELKIPTFSLFGPSNGERYKPLGAFAYAFQGPCPYGRTFERRCPLMRTCPTGACLHDVKASTIYSYFKDCFEKA
jgi:heptosyltransferase-1